nr:MAG TPA: hypothetical protein [Caudoviricetes sp.]
MQYSSFCFTFLPYGLLTRHLRMPAVIYRRFPHPYIVCRLG